MKTLLKVSSALIIASAVITSSCKDEETKLTIQDTIDISEESTTESYYQDMDDVGSVVLKTPTDPEYSTGGRVGSTIMLSVTDYRFNCNNITVSLTPDVNSNIDIPKGVIVVDFGTGCTDKLGNTRAGKVIFTYQGKRFQQGSTVVTTVDNYSYNGIKLEGTRTSTNIQASTVDAPKFRVILENGKATFPNGSIAERKSDITWSLIRGTVALDDVLIVDKSSTASGKTRNGKTYDASLLSDLEYHRLCAIAVKGKKRYIVESKDILIDYGDGGCDQAITLTINGVTRNITVN